MHNTVTPFLFQSTHPDVVRPGHGLGDQHQQRTVLVRASPLADGPAGDGEAAGAGMCPPGDHLAALPDVSTS